MSNQCESLAPWIQHRSVFEDLQLETATDAPQNASRGLSRVESNAHLQLIGVVTELGRQFVRYLTEFEQTVASETDHDKGVILLRFRQARGGHVCNFGKVTNKE